MQRPDWGNLFLKYDSNSDGLLTKENVEKMMEDAGMKYATNAEIQFAFTVISKYRQTLQLQTFVNWGKSMEG